MDEGQSGGGSYFFRQKYFRQFVPWKRAKPLQLLLSRLISSFLAKFLLMFAGLCVPGEGLVEFGLCLSRFHIRTRPEWRVRESSSGLPFESVFDGAVWKDFPCDGFEGSHRSVVGALDYVGLDERAAAAQNLLIAGNCSGSPVARVEGSLKYLEPVWRRANEYLLPPAVRQRDFHDDAAKQRLNQIGPGFVSGLAHLVAPIISNRLSCS
jgi:hypothetical protein